MGVNIDKVGSGYSKRYVDSRFVVSVIYNQWDNIGRISHNLQNYSKEIKRMSTKMGGMGKDVIFFEK